MEQQTVSIIMAAYNAEVTIQSAIRSVQVQTYPFWELLVVNDCSTDNTPAIVSELAESDSRIKLLNNVENRGVSLSRKKALDAAAGKWIAILDSDDMWAAEKLEIQLSLAEQKGAELIFTGSAFVDSDDNHIDWYLSVPEKLEYRRLLKQNLISNSSVLVKKELYRQFFAVGDDMHEDFAIWLCITKSGRAAYVIDEPLLVYRVSKTSKTGNKITAAKMNWKTYRYVGLNPFAAFYNMCWYTVKGLQKYKHLK